MSNSFSGMGGCQERTGFLFPHPCDNVAVYACGRCGKSICADHTVWAGADMSCTTCAKLGAADPSRSNASDTSNSGTSDASSSTIDNPYFYRQHHMSDWDDQGDFTEGEQGALFEGDEDDLAGFEDDMGAS